MKSNIEKLLKQWGFSEKDYLSPIAKKYVMPYADCEIICFTNGENFKFVFRTNDHACRFTCLQLKEIYEKIEKMQCILEVFTEI